MDFLAIQTEAENRILRIRNTEVMLDRDVAELYGEETAEINRKVRNNPEKFIGDLYAFDLTKDEKNQLILENARLNNQSFKSSPNVKVYTEYGILMLATTFQKSNEVAIKICHVIVNTFVEYRKRLQESPVTQSIILELKRDIELLKNFAISQHNKNQEYDEHLGIVFEHLDKMSKQKEATQTQSEKKSIGFQPKAVIDNDLPTAQDDEEAMVEA
jgi:ORF6N domain